jgi:hypothetical protein
MSDIPASSLAQARLAARERIAGERIGKTVYERSEATLRTGRASIFGREEVWGLLSEEEKKAQGGGELIERVIEVG